MRKLTAEQILEVIKNNYDVSSFAYGEYNELLKDSQLKVSEEIGKREQNEKDDLYDIVRKESVAESKCISEHPRYEEYKKLKYGFEVRREYILQQLGLGQIVEVEQYGGEGQGDDWYSVKHFVDHDVYIKTDGYYSSYNGTDFNYGYGKEVKPVERTVTFYE